MGQEMAAQHRPIGALAAHAGHVEDLDRGLEAEATDLSAGVDGAQMVLTPDDE